MSARCEQRSQCGSHAHTNITVLNRWIIWLSRRLMNLDPDPILKPTVTSTKWRNVFAETPLFCVRCMLGERPPLAEHNTRFIFTSKCTSCCWKSLIFWHLVTKCSSECSFWSCFCISCYSLSCWSLYMSAYGRTGVCLLCSDAMCVGAWLQVLVQDAFVSQEILWENCTLPVLVLPTWSDLEPREAVFSSSFLKVKVLEKLWCKQTTQTRLITTQRSFVLSILLHWHRWTCFLFLLFTAVFTHGQFTNSNCCFIHYESLQQPVK